MAESTRALLLIIDDDRASRRLLTQLLSPDKYRLEFAEDGASGLAQARQLSPDLVLLDVVMPGMDGFEVCRQLRQDAHLSEVPVLMLTALEDHANRLTGLEAGADDFISKPFHAAELRARVRTVVRLNRYRRIRSARDRFAWVAENVEHAYLIVDQNGRLLYANSTARSILGLRDDHPGDSDILESIQRQFRLQPPETWCSWPNLPEDQPLHLLRPQSENAAAAWLEVRVLSQRLGQDQEILLQFRDVSAQLSSARSVWSFESLICHKLRTPMTKITWGLSFIANKAERLSVPKIKEFAAMSQGGVDQLKGELEAVLSYLSAPSALPNDGGFPISQLEDSLSEIVAQLEMAPIVPQLREPLPRTLPIARRALEIVLWELLQNSKKFHPQQQPRVMVTLQCQAEKVLLQLIDDGISLSPEQLSRAFTPYYQGERTFTGQKPGLGLGLSMVRSLLCEIGGECGLRNRQDREGVVVELLFPSV
ncbi:response regulator [bacterium]|nr:response regulator [bacterium]